MDTSKAAIIQRAWESYWRTRSDRDRNFLVEIFAPEVKRVARYFPRVRKADLDDLHGVGYLALVRAVEMFDPARMPWDRFLFCRLRFEMVDHIRRASGWVPKSVRDTAERVEQAEEEVRNAKGRIGTPEEVAAHLGVSVEEYEEKCRSFRATDWTVASLDFAAETEAPWVESIADPDAEIPEETALAGHTAEELHALIERLSPREQRIIRAVFFEGMEQRDLACELSRHESRVSQLLAQAIRRLRALSRQQTLPADLFTQEEPQCANA